MDFRRVSTIPGWARGPSISFWGLDFHGEIGFGGGGGGGGAVKVGNITQKGQHRPTRKLQTSANFFGGGMSRAARRGLQWTQPT